MTIDDKVVLDNFHFAHVYKWNATQEDVKEWAIDFAKEEIGKKFPECLDSINWDTIDITEVCDD